MYAPVFLPAAPKAAPEVLAAERGIIEAEGPYHVEGLYYAREADAAQQRRRAAERIVSEHLREELMRQFARRVVLATLATKKRDDWRVVRGAQFAQRLPRLRGFPARIPHDCPARGVEGMSV